MFVKVTYCHPISLLMFVVLPLRFKHIHWVSEHGDVGGLPLPHHPLHLLVVPPGVETEDGILYSISLIGKQNPRKPTFHASKRIHFYSVQNYWHCSQWLLGSLLATTILDCYFHHFFLQFFAMFRFCPSHLFLIKRFLASKNWIKKRCLRLQITLSLEFDPFQTRSVILYCRQWWDMPPLPLCWYLRWYWKGRQVLTSVLPHLSKGQLSKEAMVQGDNCPKDSCTRRFWSEETFVQGSFYQW